MTREEEISNERERLVRRYHELREDGCSGTRFIHAMEWVFELQRQNEMFRAMASAAQSEKEFEQLRKRIVGGTERLCPRGTA